MTRLEYISAVTAKLRGVGFTDADVVEAERLLEAAAMTLAADVWDRDPKMVQDLLATVTEAMGYDCWLSLVEMATKEVATEAYERSRLWAWRMNAAMQASVPFVDYLDRTSRKVSSPSPIAP